MPNLGINSNVVTREYLAECLAAIQAGLPIPRSMTPLGGGDDDTESYGVAGSSAPSSPISTVPTFESEWSKKAYAGDPQKAKHQFNYSAVNWEVLPGFTVPLDKVPKRLMSPLWQFGVPIEHDKELDRYWLCTECHTTGAEVKHLYNVARGLSNAADHVRNVHKKTWGKDNKVVDHVPGLRRLGSELPPEVDASDSRAQAHMNALATAFDEATFRRLLTRWVVYDNVSFRQMDSEPFREFIAYLSPRGGDSLPKSNTIRTWILQAYALHKPVVKHLLSKAQSKIHICFDLWTSGNNQALNGITAHFIDRDFKSQAIVLGVPQQKGAHGGDNIAAHVISTLDDFGIGSTQLGYFVLDNATNNDTAIEAIAENYGFDAGERRLRCAGHIINLIARSLLYGFDRHLFEEEEQELSDEVTTPLEKQLVLWRRAGPVGKAHLAVLWIYASPQRVARWLAGKLSL